MDTVVSALGSIPEIVDKDTGGIILRGRVNSVKDAVAIYQTYFTADYENSRARALQQALIDNAPPYSEARERALGLFGRANVNWGHAAQAQEEAEQPYHDVFESIDVFGSTPTTYGEDESQKRYYGDCIADEISRMLVNWDDYYPNRNQLIQLFTKEGLGFIFFQDENTWKFEVRGQQHFKFARRTRANVNSLDIVACRVEMQPHELYERIKDEEVAVQVGWNPPACFEAIKDARERGLETDNPESWQKDVKDMNIYSSITGKTISVVHLLVREVDGSVTHLIARYDAKGDFLYKGMGKWQNMNRCLIAFANAVGSNGDFHSIRGNGYRIYQSATALNRMLCKAMDYFIHQSTPYLTYQSEDAISNSAFHPVGPYVAIGNDLQFVQNPMPNTANGLMPALQMVESIFSTRARMAAPAVAGASSQGGEKTKYQVQVETEQSGRMTTASFNLFFSAWGRMWKELVRRVCREDYHPRENGGEEVWAMRSRLLKRGVPLEALYAVDVDACEVNTGIGKGSVSERRAQVDALMERLFPMLDPQGQQSLLRLVGSAYGGVKMAKELVPDMAGLRPPIDASFAKMENSVMALGQPPSFEPNQNHAVHIEQHLARVDELSQMLSNGEIDITEAIPQMEPIWSHAQDEHLPLLDPQSSQTAQFREALQQFGEVIVNGGKMLAKMQEKAAKEGGEMEAEAGMGTDAVSRQAADASARYLESVKVQATAASLQLDLAAKQQKIRQSALEAQQKLAINDALAAQKIRNSTAEKRAKRQNDTQNI